MGLADDLGYEYPRQNLLRGAMASIFATAPGSWLSYHVGHHVDWWILRLSGGRATLSGWLTALPPIWVTTTGARSGQPRRSPLLGIPIGDDLALIGSGFGQESTPGWVYNLQAYPWAAVAYGNRSINVWARPATEEERSDVWATAAGLYPGYRHYRDRVSHRAIRVFILEAV